MGPAHPSLLWAAGRTLEHSSLKLPEPQALEKEMDPTPVLLPGKLMGIFLDQSMSLQVTQSCSFFMVE